MRRMWHVLVIVLLATMLNYGLAFLCTAIQPLRLYEEGPTPAKSAIEAELVRDHPAVRQSDIEVHVVEATTGLGRRVVIATGFDESRYVAGPKTNDEWVRIRHGPMIVGSRSAKYYGIHESRDVIPILYVRVFSGWPFPALSTTLVSDNDPERTKDDFIHSRAVPIVPVLPGFILNTIANAFLLAGIYLLVLLILGSRRAAALANSRPRAA